VCVVCVTVCACANCCSTIALSLTMSRLYKNAFSVSKYMLQYLKKNKQTVNCMIHPKIMNYQRKPTPQFYYKKTVFKWNPLLFSKPPKCSKCNGILKSNGYFCPRLVHDYDDIVVCM